MPKFICVAPDDHHKNRPVEVEAVNKYEAQKMMCKGCVPVCSGPERTPELTPGQMSLFEQEDSK